MNGIRARSTTLRMGNGNVVSVINIGVPSEHPLADSSSMAGPSGLHNVQVGGIQMPAPQFVVVHRSGESEPGAEGAAASNSNGQPSNNNGGDG